jgi:transcriptional regulator with XRE-family HTH domain
LVSRAFDWEILSGISVKMTSTPSVHRVSQSNEIGRLIAEGRKRANLSQSEFAAQLGVSRKTVSDIERGVAEHLSLNTALQALWLAGFQLEALPRRPPTLSEVMARRASDRERAEQLAASGGASDSAARSPRRKR